MFNEDSIMTYEDFNYIEQKIVTLRTTLISIGYSIEIYTVKNWTENDFLIYTYLNNIEDGINNLAEGYFKPYGWQNKKIWTKGMSFSYKDVNRWIENLNLIENELNTKPNRTIWNGKSFENWDSYDTGLEWEE